MGLLTICPQPLVRIPEPFNDPDWIFELKFDGFRALAYVEDRECRLISRNAHSYKTFDPLRAALLKELKVKSAILDGEIVYLDPEGKSQFNPLLFRRCSPVFAAFDILWLNGKDLRQLPLIERKQRLRGVVPAASAHVMYVDSIAEQGKELFALACDEDLEGIVGKRARGSYQSDGRSTSWVKIKNPSYSQAEGRADLFDGKGRGTRARGATLVLK
jgi:bifunctional non-homologous end joining protein LigD